MDVRVAQHTEAAGDNTEGPWTLEPAWIDPAIGGADPGRVRELVTAAADKDAYAWARTDWFDPPSLVVVAIWRVRNDFVVTVDSPNTERMYTEPFADATDANNAAEVACWVQTVRRWNEGDAPLWREAGGNSDVLGTVRKARPAAVAAGV